MKVPYNVGVGVGVIVCRDGKILMLQRAGAHGAATWAPPGGKMDHGEDPAQTAVREVKEETGLEVSKPVYIGFTNDVFESDGLHYITLWYVTNDVRGVEKIREPDKCTALVWYELSKPPEPLFIPTGHILNDEAAVQQIKKSLEKQTG